MNGQPAPEVSLHRVDSKLWIDQNENEDDFYSNLGHSFDYQPDPIADSDIDNVFFGSAEDRDLLHAVDNVASDDIFMTSASVRSQNDDTLFREKEIVTSDISGSPSSKPHIDPNEDLIKIVMLESESACKHWKEIVTKCDLRFSQLEQEIQNGLGDFQKTIDSLILFSKSMLQMVEQLRATARQAIEEGEAKVNVGQNLRAMLVDANRITKSFEKSVSMRG